MKRTLNYTIGYIGYFLMAYVSLRLLIADKDVTGYTLTTIGLLFIATFTTSMEKQIEAPKYAGYIKFVIIIVFFFVSMVTLLY